MSNIIAELQAVLTISNNLMSPPPYIGNFDFGNPTLNANSFFSDVFLAITGGVSIALPGSPVFCVIVQNISTSGQVLQVAVTPTGGSAQTYSYGPSGMFVHIDPNETGAGITALTLTGVGGTVPAFVSLGV